MKVAVSIPDDVFAEADHLAARMNASRSQLYARALDEFIGTHAPDRLTEQWNAVVADVADAPDPLLGQAARRILDGVEW